MVDINSFNPLTYKVQPLTNLYIKITNQLPFTKAEANDPMERVALKGVARFVASVVFLRFFAVGGMIYNGVGAAAKGIKGAVELVQGNPQVAAKDVEKAVRHCACFLIDGVASMSYASLLFGLFHAFIPQIVTRTYEVLTEISTGKNQVNLA